MCGHVVEVVAVGQGDTRGVWSHVVEVVAVGQVGYKRCAVTWWRWWLWVRGGTRGVLSRDLRVEVHEGV